MSREQCLSLERNNSVRRSSKVVTVAETNPAYLHCTVPHASDYLVAWTRLSDDALLTAGSQSFTTDVRFQISPKRQARDWVLIIRRVQLSDAGCYLCEVNTEPMSTFYPVYLEVRPEEQEKTKPAVIPKQSAQLMIKMDNNALYLNCTVGTNEKQLMPTTVIWTRNSEQLDLNDEISETVFSY
uniref:Ig-like domain-containing protein n=1 Tax=Panagrolaimus sp. JU765 TaxID=591449 RepID=A0AC34QC86_9BILA